MFHGMDKGQSSIIINKLNALPLELLRPSALVDFLLLLACNKPAVRICAPEKAALRGVQQWCRFNHLDFESDEDGFVCIAWKSGAAQTILAIDRSLESHEFPLGIALGYPRCCCRKVARVGEKNI